MIQVIEKVLMIDHNVNIMVDVVDLGADSI